MQGISKIVCFNIEENLFSLLQGYCFTKNISITAFDFSLASIRDISNIFPELLVVPVSILRSSKRSFEVSALRRELDKNKGLKICGMFDSSISLPCELPVRFDFVIHHPFDIAVFDTNLNSIFGAAKSIAERRSRERRSSTDRRNAYPVYNYGHPGANLHGGCDNKGQVIDFKLDSRNRCLRVNAQKVELTPKEYGLIELLMTDVNRVFLPEEIIRHLWPENTRATKSDLYQYMHMLRKKIEDDPNNPKWLTNIKGHGYKLNIGESSF